MYWDIYKNYYANKQEEEGVVITPGIPVTNNWVKTEFIHKQVSSGSENVVLTFTPIQNTSIQEFDLAVSSGYEFVFRVEFIKPVSKEFVSKMSVYTELGPENVMDYEYPGGTKQFALLNKENTTEDSTVWYMTSKPGGGIQAGITAGTKGIIDGIDSEIIGQNDIELTRFPLKNIDDMRSKILAAPIGTPLVINNDTSSNGIPYNVETKQVTDEHGDAREARYRTMCGLGIKTHLSDLFNNWLQTDWIDGENGINDLTKIDTSEGNFTVNEFIFEYKLFRMMNRIAISDGSYDAWQTAVYGQEGRVITESPIYCGGYSCEIAFDEVVSNAATDKEPLGSLAGRGAAQQQTKQGGRNIKINCDEAMLIMVINSFTPRTTYCENEMWWNDLESMDDLHKPDMDGIAFQNLSGGWFAGWSDEVDSNGNVTHEVIGKQPSWTEYTTAVNETHGSFVAGGELEHMVFNRSYQGDSNAKIENATSYIDPTEFNVVFADQRLSTLPFWVQIGLNLTSRRKMSANQIPLL